MVKDIFVEDGYYEKPKTRIMLNRTDGDSVPIDLSDLVANDREIEWYHDGESGDGGYREYFGGIGIYIKNDNTINLKATKESELGGIRLGYPTDSANKNYAVFTDSDGRAYVHVPWAGGNSGGGSGGSGGGSTYDDSAIRERILKVEDWLYDLLSREQAGVESMVEDIINGKYFVNGHFAGWIKDELDTYLISVGAMTENGKTWSYYAQQLNLITAAVNDLQVALDEHGAPLTYEMLLTWFTEAINNNEAIIELKGRYALTDRDKKILKFLSSGINIDVDENTAFTEVFATRSEINTATDTIAALRTEVDGKLATVDLAATINNQKLKIKNTAGLLFEADLDEALTTLFSKSNNNIGSLTIMANKLGSEIALNADLISLLSQQIEVSPEWIPDRDNPTSGTTIRHADILVYYTDYGQTSERVFTEITPATILFKDLDLNEESVLSLGAEEFKIDSTEKVGIYGTEIELSTGTSSGCPYITMSPTSTYDSERILLGGNTSIYGSATVKGLLSSDALYILDGSLEVNLDGDAYIRASDIFVQDYEGTLHEAQTTSFDLNGTTYKFVKGILVR